MVVASITPTTRVVVKAMPDCGSDHWKGLLGLHLSLASNYGHADLDCGWIMS